MKKKQLDKLAWDLAFSQNKKKILEKIISLSQEHHLKLASIYNFYLARAEGKIKADFTLPAFNLRTLTYDLAEIIFQTAKKFQAAALIFELAPSEMDYTFQTPQEYAGMILLGALKAGYQGPLFLQGDHFQLKSKKEKEKEKLEKLIKKSLQAGFYNFDLDCSALVDYSQKSLFNQQKDNFTFTAKLIEYVRKIEPKRITVSLGGEVSSIGGKKTTMLELETFIKGCQSVLKKNLSGLIKIAVQSGTSHGGKILPSGKLAKPRLDFKLLKNLSQLANKYRLAGIVQHGASTLPNKLFSYFPAAEVLEIHLATAWQNLILDHSLFPKKLRKKMYQWLEENLSQEKKENQNQKQFFYQLRKKALGSFKKEIWQTDKNFKEAIKNTFAKKTAFLLEKLKVKGTLPLIKKFV